MSWILGAVNVPDTVIQEARGLVSQTPLLLVQDAAPPLYLAAGGLPATCMHAHDASHESGWVVSGTGLKADGAECQVYNETHWSEALASPALNISSINGHFVIVRWDNQGVHCYTDALGVRSLYFSRFENGVLFSTRLDWLAQLTRAWEIDFKEFGSQWLTFNQLSGGCPVYDLQRLQAGGYLYANRTGYTRTNASPWQPSWVPSKTDDFLSALTSFVTPRLPSTCTLSLGLSGGLDSRLLLALRINRPPAIHTFGPSSSPDVQIATSIAQDLNLRHTIFHEAIPDEGGCLALLKDHVVRSHAITTASASLGLRYFGRLHEQQYAMIDGGFGEIARRQFLNRLLLRGKKDLVNENYEEIVPLIYTPRPALFNQGTLRAMREGALAQFSALWNELPSHKEIGLENKLDLFSIRTRLPNFFGYEQHRLDGYLLNYMPFAQLPVLEHTLGLPLRTRKNGRLFKSLIRRMHKPLGKHHLAKGSTRVPFAAPTLMSSAVVKARNTFKKADNPYQHLFLQRLESYALDTLHSIDVRSFEAYDYPKIESTVTAYYKGHTEHADFVDWWLAFDAWRQQLSAPLEG